MTAVRGAILTALAAALAGAGVIVLGMVGAVGTPTQVIGGNRPVDVSAAQDSLGVSAQNSPALVMNPRDPANLVVVNRVDTPRFSCALHVSGDGGTTWEAVGVPLGEVTTGVGCFAPDAAFGPDGALYLSYTSASAAAPTNVWVAVSHDGGRTFRRPVVAAGGRNAFHVRTAADPSMAGRVYLTWVEAAEASRWGFVGANPVVAARSDDGGVTWSRPTRLSPPSRTRVVAPAPTVTAGGEFVVAYVDVGDDRLDYEGAHEGIGGDPYAGQWQLVAARSSDQGRTWEETTVDRLVPSRRFVQLFPPFPAVAVGRGSNVFIGFADDGHGPGDTGVSVWVSADGGRRWSAARPVGGSGVTSRLELPALAVAPDGRLDVLIYEVTGQVEAVAVLRSSTDGGRSFGRRVLLSDQPFDPRIGFGADRGLPELGTRLGLVARDGGALAIWTDTRAGTRATNRQDLAQAVVALSRPSRAGQRTLGSALIAGGAAVLAGTVIALRRRGRTGGGHSPGGLVARRSAQIAPPP